MRLGRVLILQAFGLAASLFGASAQAQTTKYFEDWAVGCDNLRTCTIIGTPPGDSGRTAFIKIVRSGEADAEPSIVFALWDEGFKAKPGIGLSLEGGKGGVPERLEVARADSITKATLGDGQARPVFDGLRQAQSVTLGVAGSPGEKIESRIALADLSPALLFMDAQQHRAGTRTALAAKGDGAADAIPPVPALPVVKTKPMRFIMTLPKTPAGVVRDGDGCDTSAEIRTGSFGMNGQNAARPTSASSAGRNVSADSIENTMPIEAMGPSVRLVDRKSTRLNSSHSGESRMPSSA